MKYGYVSGSGSVSAAALRISRLSLARGGLPCALSSVSSSAPFVGEFGVPFSSDSGSSGEFGSLDDSLFMTAHLVKNFACSPFSQVEGMNSLRRARAAVFNSKVLLCPESLRYGAAVYPAVREHGL